MRRLTPEEDVRRAVIDFLTTKHGVPPTLIAREWALDVNGQTQRADIVVFDNTAKPRLLVECKAPSVKIDERTLSQAFRYNTVLGAPYVMLTNGTDHYIYKVDPAGTYSALKSLPEALGILAGGNQ